MHVPRTSPSEHVREKRSGCESPLRDKDIRLTLVDHLQKHNFAPKAVLEEVRVHNGNAIADVVAIHKFAHCYEIKGETDVLRRLFKQGAFYDQAFRRITLVTTENHLQTALLIVPAHWGIILAKKDQGETDTPKLQYVRKATDSPRFNKQVALLMLWKRELLSAYKGGSPTQKLNRHNLTKLLAEQMNDRDISLIITDALASRHASNGWPLTI
jgi:hypothetical protein